MADETAGMRYSLSDGHGLGDSTTSAANLANATLE